MRNSYIVLSAFCRRVWVYRKRCIHNSRLTSETVIIFVQIEGCRQEVENCKPYNKTSRFLLLQPFNLFRSQTETPDVRRTREQKCVTASFILIFFMSPLCLTPRDPRKPPMNIPSASRASALALQSLVETSVFMEPYGRRRSCTEPEAADTRNEHGAVANMLEADD